MTTTTHKKAPGTCVFKGLPVDIISRNSSTTAHEGKVFASLTAFFALADFQVFQNLEIEACQTVYAVAAVCLCRALINAGVAV